MKRAENEFLQSYVCNDFFEAGGVPPIAQVAVVLEPYCLANPIVVFEITVVYHLLEEGRAELTTPTEDMTNMQILELALQTAL